MKNLIKRIQGFALLMLVCGIVSSCASIDVTKTAKGFHEPTDPNEVEILMTKPTRPYEELGTVNATGFGSTETAKMHNGLRAKAAPLGANAIIITNSGMLDGGKQWVMGVAISYTTGGK